MKVEEGLPRRILEKLYRDYFPEPCLVARLCKDLGMEKEAKSVLAAGRYLADKGLIKEDRMVNQARRWRIAAKGVEFLEGQSLEKYKCILEEMRYTQTVVWHAFGAFLLPHTIFLAFLLRGFGAVGSTRLGVFITALIGVGLCFPWLAAYLRGSKFFHFRRAQAGEVEPLGWDLIKAKGKGLSKGKLVKIGEEKFRMRGLARVPTKWAVRLLIFGFLGIYSFIAIWHNPWMN